MRTASDRRPGVLGGVFSTPAVLIKSPNKPDVAETESRNRVPAPSAKHPAAAGTPDAWCMSKTYGRRSENPTPCLASETAPPHASRPDDAKRAHAKSMQSSCLASWCSAISSQNPSFVYRCSNPHAAPHCFPDGAFETTPSGLHVNGVDRLYIELPDTDSSGSPRVTIMRRECDTALYAPKMWGMSESSGFAVADNAQLRLYSRCDEKNPSATLATPAAIKCVASSRHTLATGHEDGVRLWLLPNLTPLGHLRAGAVRSVALSSDGIQVVVHNDAIAWQTSVWNTQSMACVREIACNSYYFDDVRHELIFFVRFSGFEYLDWIGRLKRNGHLKFEAALDTGYKRIYVPARNEYLSIGYDQSVIVSALSDKASCFLAYPHPFGEELIGDIIVSRDGRWLAVLLERGDVLMWDLAATKPPS